MDDPRRGPIMPPPPEGPDPAAQAPSIPGFKSPRIGDHVHFFPHRGHHPEWNFAPMAGIIIRIHPADPRIAHIFWIGPDGQTGSYADIPHRSLQQGCLQLENWLGRAMPPATHWAYPEESP